MTDRIPNETAGKADTMSTFDIDSDFVRKLAGLLEETGLAEIEYADGDRRIRLSRGAPMPATIGFAAPPAPMQAAAPPPQPAAILSAAQHPGALKSPMVGTAYLAPEPGAAPFVRAGDTVKAGQTVLIIEAMKVMNPIKAPKGGTVVEVLVDDAQPVEYGEPLLIIE